MTETFPNAPRLSSDDPHLRQHTLLQGLSPVWLAQPAWCANSGSMSSIDPGTLLTIVVALEPSLLFMNLLLWLYGTYHGSTIVVFRYRVIGVVGVRTVGWLPISRSNGPELASSGKMTIQ